MAAHAVEEIFIRQHRHLLMPAAVSVAGEATRARDVSLWSGGRVVPPRGAVIPPRAAALQLAEGKDAASIGAQILARVGALQALSRVPAG